MNSNRKNEQDKVKVSSIADRRILTVWDQDTRKKKSAKKINKYSNGDTGEWFQPHMRKIN